MKTLIKFLAVLATTVTAVAINFAGWFYLASLDTDPTSGGAYCAAAMLFVPVAAIIGAIVGLFVVAGK